MVDPEDASGSSPPVATSASDPMRMMLVAVASILFAVACSGDPAPTPAPRTQTDFPLTELEVGRCMTAGPLLSIYAIAAGGDDPGGPAFDLVADRIAEYERDIRGDDDRAIESLPPEEAFELAARMVQRLGRDADIALVCRTTILPALETIE